MPRRKRERLSRLFSLSQAIVKNFLAGKAAFRLLLSFHIGLVFIVLYWFVEGEEKRNFWDVVLNPKDWLMHVAVGGGICLLTKNGYELTRINAPPTPSTEQQLKELTPEVWLSELAIPFWGWPATERDALLIVGRPLGPSFPIPTSFLWERTQKTGRKGRCL